MRSSVSSMRSRRGLDPGLTVGIAASLLFHVAAIGAVAMVRFDVISPPILVELVELTAPAPVPSPVQPAKPAKAAPSAEPERAAPAVPEPPVVPDRAEPRVSVAISAAALPEHVIAPRVVRRASEEPPALPVSQDHRARPVAAASARPERPAAERSEETLFPALSPDTVALPEKVERRPTLLAADPTRTPEQPSLASAEPAPPARPIVEPPVVERSAEPHLTTLLSSRTSEMEAPVIPSVSSTPSPAAARPTPELAGDQLLAALPRGGNSGAFIAPRLTAPKKPRYPEAARQAGIEGTVLVKAFVLADGSVREARVERSAGNAALDSAALRTIRESRFTPAHRGGKPVPVWVEVPIDFRLER